MTDRTLTALAWLTLAGLVATAGLWSHVALLGLYALAWAFVFVRRAVRAWPVSVRSSIADVFD